VRVAIYARVSTTKQTTENQVPVLIQWCQQRGWEIVATYQEDGSAWESGHQPELARLSERARKGEYDLLAVWALDRITRAGIGAIFQMVDKFKRYGVRIVSYQEGWTEAPGDVGDLYLAIAAWIKAGLARRKLEGKGVRGPDIGRRKRRWRRRPTVVDTDDVNDAMKGMSTKEMLKFAQAGYAASLKHGGDQ
jgi:putative DNA-invertase from lambdoid prophage Rac